MISSPEINKVLRKRLSPILRENGFSKVTARKSWGWNDDCICVFNIRAVGKHFSDVTGWSPMSVCVWIGVYYEFFPVRKNFSIKSDAKGRLLPKENSCQSRSHLTRTIDQTKEISHLSNPAEHKRKDIWWIDPDGSNVIEVVEDIILSFKKDGKDWFKKHTDLNEAFLEIEKRRDCYGKFNRAKYFAKHLNLVEKYKMYSNLAKNELEKNKKGRRQ